MTCNKHNLAFSTIGGCPDCRKESAPPSGSDPYVAADGKHYWNCWTTNYQPERDGYCIHAFCEEDLGTRALCGAKISEGGGQSVPREEIPSCLKCRRIMIKRGALNDQNMNYTQSPSV